MIILVFLARIVFTNGNTVFSNRRTRVIYLTWFILLTFISGFRGLDVGKDTLGYFVGLSDINDLGIQAFVSYNVEPLYTALCLIIGKFTSNGQILLIVCSAIIVACILKFVDQFSIHPTLSVFLYIGLYFFFMSMNGTRQFIGIGILLLATKYARDRKFWHFIIAVLTAIGFHSSCVLGLFIWFLYGKVDSKTNKKAKIFIIAFVCLIMFLSMDIITAWLASHYRNLAYYLVNSGAEEKSGIMLPILCTSVFLIGLCAYTDPEWRNNPDNMFLFYTSEIAAIWSIGSAIFVGLNYNLIQRIGWLYQIYSIALLPNALNSAFFRRLHSITYILIVLAATAYLYYYLRINWHHVVPYSFYF